MTERLNPLRSRIVSFMHCAKCGAQKPSNESLEKWAKLNVGLTPTGIEVWCVRHRMLVAHVTPAELTKMLDEPLHCDCCPRGQHVVVPSKAEPS